MAILQTKRAEFEDKNDATSEGVLFGPKGKK